MRSQARLSRRLSRLIPVLALPACAWCVAGRTMVNGVAATVNGEVVTMSEVAKIVDTQEMIMRRCSSDEIKRFARKELGMQTLRDTGMINFLSGKTTLEEVLRVTSSE